MIPDIRIPQDPDGAELARDIIAALKAIVPLALLFVTAVYEEPFLIAFDHEPAGVLCIRCREDDSPETTIAITAVCSFTYTSQGVRIDTIEGPSEGTAYRFAFLMVG